MIPDQTRGLFLEMVSQAVKDLRRKRSTTKAIRHAKNAYAFLKCRACNEILQDFGYSSNDAVRKLEQDGIVMPELDE